MVLISNMRLGQTVVSNAFIDRYLPSASGEYVKVYIMLLRLMGDRNMEFSMGALADSLEHTEKDVIRALTYWEKQGLLDTVYDNGQLSQVIMKDIPAEEEVCVTSERNAAPAAKADMKQEARGSEAAVLPDKSYDLTALQADEEFRQLLFVSEMYLGRTLTAKDTDLFAYLYENLNFSADLIEYLVEYCVGGGHKSTKYMEAVALGWHSEGKTTVEQVKEAGRTYTKENKAVMKAFGIRNRVLGTEEQKFVTRWLKEYGLPLEVVIEACNRTMSAIHQPSFEYADKILKDWYESGVTNPDEAKVRAEERRREKKAADTAVKAPARQAAGRQANRFHNFDQRTTDYNALFQGEIKKNGADQSTT